MTNQTIDGLLAQLHREINGNFEILLEGVEDSFDARVTIFANADMLTIDQDFETHERSPAEALQAALEEALDVARKG